MTIRAVVVDDDKDTLNLFCDLLTSHKIKIAGKGRNGQEAVFLYQKLKPDVTFLDDNMPVVSGVEALQKIREVKPDAKVIMVTADMSSETKKKLREMKPTDVIYKPYDVEKIIDHLE